MNIVEEPGVIVSIDGRYANVAPVAQKNCQSCTSGTSCGTTLLAPLFTKKIRMLVVENNINARVGDQVIIGLNGTALVFASLMVYLFPLFVLILAAIAGESLALGFGLENGEIVAIFTALAAAALAFLLVRHAIRSPLFSAFFEPVLISRQ